MRQLLVPQYPRGALLTGCHRALRQELLQRGITDNSLKFLWSVFEHDPELASRLRVPGRSPESNLEFEYVLPQNRHCEVH